MPNSNAILREERNLQPAHFTLKINSYSLLSNARGDNYESGCFSVGGYKWKLILYPNGKRDNDGDGHISLYLAIDKPNSFRTNSWRIPVNFKLFVLNQNTNLFLTIQDAGAVTYFDKLETKRGFRKFLSLEKFNDPSKGYLVNDCCTFGAEVFVIQPSAQKEILTMVKRPNGRSYTWKIKKFSKLNDQVKWSDEFTVEGRKWIVFIYPKGNGSGSGKYLSLYMKLADWGRVLPKRKVYAEYKLRVLDHRGVKNVEKECSHWFNSEEGKGRYDFMLLKDIYKLSNGYLKDDTLTVHVEFGVISVTFSKEK